MAVAQLYFHLAPKAEVGVIAKALVRLLRSHRSVAPGLWWSPILPPQLVGPMGSPRTLGETPKKPIPAGTSGWGELPKKRAFWPGPVQTWGGSIVVAPVWWWVLPRLRRDLRGGVWPCPADGRPLFVPTARCSMSCCRTWPPCPSNGG